MHPCSSSQAWRERSGAAGDRYRRWPGSRSSSYRERSRRSSGRTAPAKRRCCGSPRACSLPTRGRRSCRALPPARRPRGWPRATPRKRPCSRRRSASGKSSTTSPGFTRRARAGGRSWPKRWSARGSRRRRTGARRRSPSHSPAASPWRSRRLESGGCCCSTRPCRAATRRAAARSATASERSRRAASPCSSRRPISPPWSGSRRGCWCCATAGSSAKRRSRRCWGSGCSRSCSMRRRTTRRPASASPPTVSRPTWAPGVRRRRSHCVACTAWPSGHRACACARSKTRCSARSATRRVDARCHLSYVSAAPMTLALYNTLTRRVEEFRPLAPPRVTLYSCGPTVWNYAHIGNFRTFLFVDLLRRWLEASRYDVFHIMNLTDVDDRIIGEAGKQGVTIGALVGPFISAFYEDRDYLRIVPAHEYPRATEFVPSMVRLVEGLLASGAAYRGEDGSVYFAIGRFAPYGRLSQLDRRELKAGASGRVSSDEYDKENARDFVLWKAAKPEDEAAGAAWDAPFGRGRPGWHLECSAMALELIGRRYGARVLDIHTGGVDLIFPHHEDEIAQSCASTGEAEFARLWVHGAFLRVRGEKMSKRFGNFVTVRGLREDGVDPGALRLLVSQTHYRQEL